LKVWIDIVNAPHARFFQSIIRYLERQGEEVFVTTVGLGMFHRLLDLFGINYHWWGGMEFTLEEKLIRSTQRAYELSQIISREKTGCTVSKHSIELPRVSYGLKIPSVFVPG
jgi:predicted glycosyltransferase